MQVALRSKISELETVEAEEKETLKATKKAVREVQRILSNKDLSMETKLDQFQQKYLQQVYLTLHNSPGSVTTRLATK